MEMKSLRQVRKNQAMKKSLQKQFSSARIEGIRFVRIGEMRGSLMKPKGLGTMLSKFAKTGSSKYQHQSEYPVRVINREKVRRSARKSRVMKDEELAKAILFQSQNQHEISARVGH